MIGTTITMLIHIHPQNPQPRQVKAVVECLEKGGIIIYPTDTIYGIGCDIFNHKAVEKICRIKQVDPQKAQLSFVCSDLSDLSKYARQLSTPTYRLLKKHLPGAYTFILPASKEVPKILKSKKDTIGLRVPDHPITEAILSAFGRPILSASLPGELVESYTDPEWINDAFKNQVDMIVDGGVGGMIPSTIIDLTEEEPTLIRKGLGDWGDD
jgi:tRNA threonylcarbamoyl adenosine modification protein (Sua5/YciO/YrdC/YwlC family)